MEILLNGPDHKENENETAEDKVTGQTSKAEEEEDEETINLTPDDIDNPEPNVRFIRLQCVSLLLLLLCVVITSLFVICPLSSIRVLLIPNCQSLKLGVAI